MRRWLINQLSSAKRVRALHHNFPSSSTIEFSHTRFQTHFFEHSEISLEVNLIQKHQATFFNKVFAD